MIEILSNGSKWTGEPPDPVDKLIEVLVKYPLDRTFELYGNFYINSSIDWVVDPKTGRKYYDDFPNAVRFFGNFFNFSHVFDIVTDESDIITKLLAAIRTNQMREDYISQRDPQVVLNEIMEEKKQKFLTGRGAAPR